MSDDKKPSWFSKQVADYTSKVGSAIDKDAIDNQVNAMKDKVAMPTAPDVRATMEKTASGLADAAKETSKLVSSSFESLKSKVEATVEAAKPTISSSIEKT